MFLIKKPITAYNEYYVIHKPQKFPAIIMIQALYIYLVPLHGNYMYLSHGKLALVFYTLENVRCV